TLNNKTGHTQTFREKPRCKRFCASKACSGGKSPRGSPLFSTTATETTLMTSSLSCSLILPKGYRVDDILSFHRRDRHQIAEVVTASSLQKGLVWQGLPARLTLYFHSSSVLAELCVDGRTSPTCQRHFVAMVQRMLGLFQDIHAF